MNVSGTRSPHRAALAPFVGYVVLAFVVSWGGLVWAAGGRSGIPAASEAQALAVLPRAVLAIVAGPIGASLLLTGWLRGRDGYRVLFARLTRWRVGPRWYAAALLAAPALALMLWIGIAAAAPGLLPAFLVAEDRAAALLSALAIAVAAGFFEEIGWTGFALPRLRTRWSVLRSGVVLGVVWAAWHVLPTIWLSGTVHGRLALTSYLLDPFLFLVGFRVLMVEVYDRTGSLLLAVLMHASLTFTARALMPPGIVGLPLIAWDAAWAAASWSAVAALRVGGRHGGRGMVEQVA